MNLAMLVNKTSFKAGILFLILLWTLFSILLPKSELPDLTADYTNDIKKLPNFSAIKNIKEKKQAFFNFLYPIIEKENLFLLRIREQLMLLDLQISLRDLTEEETEWLAALREDYALETEDPEKLIQQLLINIQIIPPSLALAQAAIESGWGTSRFSRKGNNLFGHWCFEQGCGLVPRNRDANKQHEVASFDTVNASIRAYMKNLNAFRSYALFRELRKKHLQDESLNVYGMLPGLEAYSELGTRYLVKVRKMIINNNLTRFDDKFFEQT